MCVLRVTCLSVMSFLCEDSKVCCKSYLCQSYVCPLRGQECVCCKSYVCQCHVIPLRGQEFVCCNWYVCQCHVLVGNIICLHCVQKMQAVKFVGTRKKRKEVPPLSQVSNFGPVLKVFYGKLTNLPFFCAKECCKSGVCQSRVFNLRGQQGVL